MRLKTVGLRELSEWSGRDADAKKLERKKKNDVDELEHP